MGLFVVVLLVALGASTVAPSSQEALPRSFVKREAQNSYASLPYYPREQYYPQRKQAPAEEEEEPSKVVALYQQLFGKEKEECGIERLSPPIIIIAIFLGIIMAVSIGVIPPLTIPPLVIPLNGLLLPDLLPLLLNPGIAPIVIQKPGKRSIDDEEDSFSGNLISDPFNMLTSHVLDVIESEDCAQRLLCEAGKYAEGAEVMISLVQFFAPEDYQNSFGIIKESALDRINCTSIECSYFDDECYD
ncbi:uncharacterized protein [Palaemon carinicauda]|uniref:uncharacterized protein n=1 Tax=Palaemon carinicauda TaxID=392227 RepID=UPI0035B5ADA0